jgi:N-acetylglucosaminyl-diphospho-decaprenol L-rhamnosyltransferase
MTDRIPPKVSIIIVTYNSAGVIRACLSNLDARSDHEIIIIDNYSVDDTVPIIRVEFPHVTVIQNSTNAGFGSAVNFAASQCRGMTILLLNPDAIISADTVAKLAMALAEDSGIGVIAPLLEHGDDELVIIAAGRAPTIWRMFLHESGASRLGRRFSFLEGNYLFKSGISQFPKDVDWTSGGCLMVSRKLWITQGGFSNRWFMYAEDVEFCLRIRTAGKRVVVDPRFRASHAVGGSSANVDGRINTLWIENLFDLYTWKIAPSRAHSVIWKYVVMSGLIARKLVYDIRSQSRNRSTRATAKASSLRYRIYLNALGKIRSAAKDEDVTPAGRSGHQAGREARKS